MSWVGLVSFLNACRAVVEVWAVHALVTDAIDVLVRSACTFETRIRNNTSSQPSQIAPWRILRPGEQSLAASGSRTVSPEAASKVWLGL